MRAIQFTDRATGKSLVLATVKKSVPGEVVPPNFVVYRSAFDGLDADVLFEWRHNSISQNVILKAPPALPEGMDPDTTRLEVVTELVESPEPVLNTGWIKQPGSPDIPDDATIGLGSLLAIRGRAYPVSDQKALALTGTPGADDAGVGVVKESIELPDGRRFIIESVGWTEIQPLLKTLTTAALTPLPQTQGGPQMAAARVWPKPVGARTNSEPMQVAALPYRATGLLVDLDLSGSVSTYTFQSATTYYIAQSFYIAGTATTTFLPGCVIKYGLDAWLLLHCPFAFPSTGKMMPVLTSKDDDQFGAMISGSTHNPLTAARQALLIYYVVESQTTVNNVRIRWASKGIEYDAYSGVTVTHSVSDSLFQRCFWGIYANMPAGTLLLNNVKKCSLYTAVSCACAGNPNTMTDDCGPFYTVANFGAIRQVDPTTQSGAGQSNPPDTMGAVGPNHFMAVLNSSVAVYDKYSGARLTPYPFTGSDRLFRVTVTNGPYQGVYERPEDPHVVYDRVSQRWIASALDVLSGHVLLAVSMSSDPVGNGNAFWATDNWRHYLVTTGGVGEGSYDYDTLGVDSNGIYIGLRLSSGGKMRIMALPKAPFLDGTALTVQDNFRIDVVGYGAPYFFPAVNLDPIGSTDPAWLVFYLDGVLHYNKLQWIGGTPTLAFTYPWPTLSIPRSFAEIAGDVWLTAPELGTTSSSIDLAWARSNLEGLTVRSVNGIQYLLTCHVVGVNSDGDNDHPQTKPADRSAVEWLQIQTSPTVTITNSGRIYDSSSTAFKFYYTPSVAMNRLGDILVGFAGSSVNDYIGVYYSGRLVSGSTTPGPVRYYAGRDWFFAPLPAGGNYGGRWGDYSQTSIDPDDLTLWTIQEYAMTPRFLGTDAQNAWGTWIAGVTPY